MNAHGLFAFRPVTPRAQGKFKWYVAGNPVAAEPDFLNQPAVARIGLYVVVPLPAVLKVQEGTRAGEDLEGLEEIAEPIAQVLDVHRKVLAENTKLRGEISRLGANVQELSDQVSESKRQYLPDVIDHLTPDGRLPTENELSGRI